MRRAAFFALFLLLAGMTAAWAQQLDTHTAPKYLWIETETMKPDGNHDAYGKFIKQFKDAMGQTELYWLAEYPIAGASNQITYVGFLNNATELEKAFQQENKVGMELAKKDPALFTQANTAISGTHTWLAKFEPDLSANTETVDHSKVTRMQIMTFQVRPGTGPDFVAMMKDMREIGLKAGDKDPLLVYRILAGEGFPGFIFVTPMNSLAELEKETPAEIQAAYTPLVRKHMLDVMRDTVVKRTSEIYAVVPTLSRPPQSYVAANPEFWQVKEEPATATTTPRKVKKEKPAALKEKQ